MKSYKLNQISLIAVITKEMNRQCVNIPTDNRMNAVIAAVNSICAEYAREPIVITPAMGLGSWLASDEVGLSSKYMASILSSKFVARYAHPNDANDFIRCIGLIKAVPELEDKIPLMYGESHEWSCIAANWHSWKLLASNDELDTLNESMQKTYAAYAAKEGC
ncbi:hypothetical protein [Yersinia massiliensis]|uniref:hypothetical protein n=1 Tax=Yersinia massiliensis TaxID=419257 RepID=UPI0028D24ACB|nr:hypothetical protein [Yersinia massiliensis]